MMEWCMGYETCQGESSHPFDQDWNLYWGWEANQSSCDDDVPWWEVEERLARDEDLQQRDMEDEERFFEEEMPDDQEELLTEDDKQFAAHLRRAEAVIKGISDSRKDHFEVVEKKNGKLKLFKSLHGKEFLKLVKKGCDDRCAQLRVVNQNPYVGIYHKVTRKWQYELRKMVEYGVLEGGVTRTVLIMNTVMEDIKAEASRPIIQDFSRRADRAAKDRKEKAISIIDQCFSERARLLVLRVDLGYRKGKFVESEDFLQDMEMVKNEWRIMSDRIKSGKVIPNVMAVFGKLEYGVLAGFHYHLVVIMKGSDHRQDINFAKMVGQYWYSEVTCGEGRYFNCNRIKHLYKKLGIGTINYHEKNKVDALKGVVIDYVVKSDYYMSALLPARKTFVQLSCTKKEKKGRRGRPRRYPSRV
nr:inovirus-type Gp2 protein [Halomonas sp. THAF5a]